MIRAEKAFDFLYMIQKSHVPTHGQRPPHTPAQKVEKAEAPAPDTKTNQQLSDQPLLGLATSQTSAPAADPDAVENKIAGQPNLGSRRTTSNRRPAVEGAAAAAANGWSQLSETPADARAPPVVREYHCVGVTISLIR